MKFRQTLRKNKFLKIMASLNWTVLCLSLLFILTLWGTIAQVQNGLYLAQERYFHSLFFLVLGFIPFPGAQLVMWVLFVNVTSAALIRFVYSWKRVGILIIHGGLILFLISGYITLKCSLDSHLTLKEGEGRNISSAFHTWELALWEHSSDETADVVERVVTAVDISQFKKDKAVNFNHQNFSLSLKEYCRNCRAYTLEDAKSEVVNASGINKLEAIGLDKEPERNTPGAVFQVNGGDGQQFDLLLYGDENKPAQIEIGKTKYDIILRLKHYTLPFTLKLIDFMMEKHPGTDTARSFKSLVAIDTNGAWREKLISMNNPLRYKNFTFYQSSYSINKRGQETSTLAVVKNQGRLMPYIATFVTFAGLVIHFVMMALNSRKRSEKKNANKK